MQCGASTQHSLSNSEPKESDGQATAGGCHGVCLDSEPVRSLLYANPTRQCRSSLSPCVSFHSRPPLLFHGVFLRSLRYSVAPNSLILKSSLYLYLQRPFRCQVSRLRNRRIVHLPVFLLPRISQPLHICLHRYTSIKKLHNPKRLI